MVCPSDCLDTDGGAITPPILQAAPQVTPFLGIIKISPSKISGPSLPLCQVTPQPWRAHCAARHTLETQLTRLWKAGAMPRFTLNKIYWAGGSCRLKISWGPNEGSAI